eukprot:8707051-Prorocentrum_lima.AAC.1
MTSSLVGSEMCIRDRNKPAPVTSPAACRSPPARPLRRPGRGRHTPFTVSYTHLTLPTICSV